MTLTELATAHRILQEKQAAEGFGRANLLAQMNGMPDEFGESVRGVSMCVGGWVGSVWCVRLRVRALSIILYFDC
jgi:hypothetical protein